MERDKLQLHVPSAQVEALLNRIHVRLRAPVPLHPRQHERLTWTHSRPCRTHHLSGHHGRWRGSHVQVRLIFMKIPSREGASS